MAFKKKVEKVEEVEQKLGRKKPIGVSKDISIS